MRIALFAPNQPTKSGIATYTAALLPWMARRHHIDLFTDEASETQSCAAWFRARVQRA